MSSLKSLSVKTELLNIFEIAEINLLMNIKGLTKSESVKNVFPGTNSILKIFVHCTRQLDNYLSKFTKTNILPKGDSDTIINNGYTLGKAIEAHLQISAQFIEKVKLLKDDKLTDPIDKGEKLYKILERLSLHFCGHLGQISFIRSILNNKIEGSYSFIKAMSEPTRRKLTKEWNNWWEKNRTNII